jgi:benzoyl-CoA reductase subunit C
MVETEELGSLSETLSNTFVESWKKGGGKVVGYPCTYVPEEIIHAAGLLPFRLRGTGCVGLSVADSYLSRTSHCSYARSILELGLTGDYGFLDGVVYTNGCDHMRRAYDNWRSHPTIPSFMHMLPVPHTITEHGLQWYKEELIIFKGRLEEFFATEITEEDLRRSVDLYNETRRLLRELYELRNAQAPPVTGAETLRLVVASVSMPRDKYNGLLQAALDEISTRDGVSDYKARLMLVGSANDDPTLVELIEQTGGLVVTDSLCFGSRFFWDLDQEEGDPLSSIASRYYNHIPCPRMYGEFPRRIEFVRDMMAKSAADGVILQTIKYCDLHGVENAMLDKYLEKEGVPVLRLEREYGPLGDTGRIRTRVQAFLERIGR